MPTTITDPQTVELLKSLANPHSGAQWLDWTKTISAAVIGVVIGALLSKRNEQNRRRAEFIEKQLRELYGPLWVTRLKIRTLSMLRQQEARASSAEYSRIYENVKDAPPEVLGRATETAGKIFTQPSIAYGNQLTTGVINPLYPELLAILERNCGLAEPETLDWLPKFIGYRESWNRPSTIDPIVLMKVQIKEEELMPFHDHIEAVFYELQFRQRHGVLGNLNPKKLPQRRSTDRIIEDSIARPWEQQNEAP